MPLCPILLPVEHGRVAEDRQEIQIHLEELGEHSWLKALLNTLTGSFGSAQYRFVARPADAPDDGHHVALGATFPLLRFADLDEVDPTSRDPWLPIARQRLEEIDADLVAQGWQRVTGETEHWWSRRYARDVREPAAGARRADGLLSREAADEDRS